MSARECSQMMLTMKCPVTGNHIFSADTYLEEKQIKSYFSRMAKENKKGNYIKCGISATECPCCKVQIEPSDDEMRFEVRKL